MKKYFLSIFKKNSNDIESLNGLRAMSILGVLVQHLWLLLQHNQIPRNAYLDTIFENFVNFIDLFFVLSGFLIYGGLYHSYQKLKRIDYLTFFKKRSLRTFPAYYFFVFIMYMFAYTQVKILSTKQNLTESELGLLQTLEIALKNPYPDLFYVSNYLGGNIAHNWSLAIEEQFYFILPFLAGLLLFKLSNKMRVILLCFLYILPNLFRTYLVLNTDDYNSLRIYIYHTTHTRFDSLLIGILAFEIVTNYKEVYQKILNSKLIFIPLIIFFLSFAFGVNINQYPVFYYTIKYNLSNISFALILLFSLQKDSYFDKVFSWPVFRPIARVSYTAYLWHIVFGGLLLGKFVNINNNFSWIKYMYGSVMTIFFTLFLSWIFYLLIEYPFLRKKEEFNHPNQIES